MTNIDRFIDLTTSRGPSGVEGLSGVDVLRVMADRGARRELGGMDRGTLRDLGFDRSGS